MTQMEKKVFINSHPERVKQRIF